MFGKFQSKRQKIAIGDYKEMVKGDEPQTAIDFINNSVQSNIDNKKEAVNDHPELAEAIKAMKEGGLISSENIVKVDSSETGDARVVA